MTCYALRRIDTGAFLASNPDPALGQRYEESPYEAEAVAWPAMSLAVMNQCFLPDADAWEVVCIVRGAAEDVDYPNVGEAVAA